MHREPVHLGRFESGRPVRVNLAERNAGTRSDGGLTTDERQELAQLTTHDDLQDVS